MASKTNTIHPPKSETNIAIRMALCQTNRSYSLVIYMFAVVGFWTLLTYLLISCKRNVDVNSELKNGNTVLHVACLNKQISGDDQEEVVQLLLKHGADPIKLNKNGKIPLDLLQISAKCHEHLKDITLGIVCCTLLY